MTVKLSVTCSKCYRMDEAEPWVINLMYQIIHDKWDKEYADSLVYICADCNDEPITPEEGFRVFPHAVIRSEFRAYPT